MDLFTTSLNILPVDGITDYYGPVFSAQQCRLYFDYLMHGIEWKPDEALILGKRIITDRKVAWYGDRPFSYTYSNTTKEARPWTTELLQLKSSVEEISGSTYNSCLLNLYHSGKEGMAYHSDGEKTLKEDAAIASVSFGAARNFLFKHKQSGQRISILLETGSLLVMRDQTQKNWLHRLPPTTKITTPRINLTFRTIVGQ
ncbi:MAG TPA: alpha-ketoglutarate-dependent dioxygenase AlkB [Flavitalea sp.]|nr:alpha-ketoglutarate-dependent dioxygenase AlkB [Flavitalea sp.]